MEKDVIALMLNYKPNNMKSGNANYDNSDLNSRVEKLEQDFIKFIDLTRSYVD